MATKSFQETFAAILDKVMGDDERAFLHAMQEDLDRQAALRGDQTQPIANAKHLITRVTGEVSPEGKFDVPEGFSSKADAEKGLVVLLNSLKGKADASYSQHIHVAANTVRAAYYGEEGLFDGAVAQLKEACEEAGLNIRFKPNGAAHIGHARMAGQHDGERRR